MPVLINFKICDNSVDCNGIAVCPTKAFFGDEKNKTIAVNGPKCINCGKCEPSCPVGAIRFARDEEEFKRIRKELDEDPRKVSDLFVDRYGAQPVHPAFNIPESEFDVQILKSTKPAVVELFSNDSIKCLLKSIPLKELLRGADVKYRKIEARSDGLQKKYGVKALPTLLFFKGGKLAGKIEGYYDNKMKSELLSKISEVLKAQE